SPVRVAGSIAARPGANEAACSRRQRIAGDVERAVRFYIGAGKRAREVQSIFCQRAEILHIVEIEVQHGAIVLSRSDERRRLAAEQEVVRIVRVKAKGPGGSLANMSRDTYGKKQHQKSNGSSAGIHGWHGIITKPEDLQPDRVESLRHGAAVKYPR